MAQRDATTRDNALAMAGIAGLLRWLGQRGHEVEALAPTSLADVLAQTAQLAVRGDALGLVWTSQSAAALCLANRRQGVRAILAASPAYVAAASADAAANVLIVDPTARAYYELRQMLAAYVAADRGRPPEFLRD